MPKPNRSLKRAEPARRPFSRHVARPPVTTPRVVNFDKAPDDIELLRCIGMGYSTKYILGRTTLTPAQVMYRARMLKAAGITRGDYRDGTGVVAKIIERHRPELDEALFQYLHEHL